MKKTRIFKKSEDESFGNLRIFTSKNIRIKNKKSKLVKLLKVLIYEFPGMYQKNAFHHMIRKKINPSKCCGTAR